MQHDLCEGLAASAARRSRLGFERSRASFIPLFSCSSKARQQPRPKPSYLRRYRQRIQEPCPSRIAATRLRVPEPYPYSSSIRSH
jgi:hypothetical protein